MTGNQHCGAIPEAGDGDSGSAVQHEGILLYLYDS